MSQPSLSPIFGTRCRTEGFAYKQPNAGTAQYVHFEAYRDRPDADSWTVRRVLQTANAASGQARTSSDVQGQRMGFAEAMASLIRFEEYHRGNTLGFSVIYPDAAAMGFNHYRAFAEREGYVFDVNARPHARPGPGLLPAAGIFADSDIARADKHLQRPEQEFGPAPATRRLPDTLFLFDAFNRRAIGKRQGNELASLRVLNLMDGFTNNIASMNAQLLDYSTDYLKPGAATKIAAAELALTQARNQLRQIAAYDVDTRAFEKMADECAIVINVAHAQGIYDQLRRHQGNFDELESLFKKRAAQALDLYAALAKKDNHPRDDDGYTALQEMIIQGGAPAIPAAIGDYVARYRQQRSAMIKPPPAKPPTP